VDNANILYTLPGRAIYKNQGSLNNKIDINGQYFRSQINGRRSPIEPEPPERERKNNGATENTQLLDDQKSQENLHVLLFS